MKPYLHSFVTEKGNRAVLNMSSVKSLQPSPQAMSVKQDQHVRSRAAVIQSGAGGFGKMLGSFCRVMWSYTKQTGREI